MKRDKLNLKQISESVVKHIRMLPTERVFGMIRVKIEEGKPNQIMFEETIRSKDIK